MIFRFPSNIYNSPFFPILKYLQSLVIVIAKAAPAFFYFCWLKTIILNVSFTFSISLIWLAIFFFFFLRGVEPMWRLGDWHGSKCKCKCFAAFCPFSSRTKSLTLICIYGDCNTILLFTSRKKISTSVLLSRYFCSCIKTNGLFQYQTRTTEWFDIFPECTSSEYYVKNIMW